MRQLRLNISPTKLQIELPPQNWQVLPCYWISWVIRALFICQIRYETYQSSQQKSYCFLLQVAAQRSFRFADMMYCQRQLGIEDRKYDYRDRILADLCFIVGSHQAMHQSLAFDRNLETHSKPGGGPSTLSRITLALTPTKTGTLPQNEEYVAISLRFSFTTQKIVRVSANARCLSFSKLLLRFSARGVGCLGLFLIISSQIGERSTVQFLFFLMQKTACTANEQLEMSYCNLDHVFFRRMIHTTKQDLWITFQSLTKFCCDRSLQTFWLVLAVSCCLSSLRVLVSQKASWLKTKSAEMTIFGKW